MLKRLSLPIFVIFLIFVSLGDKFLPEPLKGASVSTRTNINQFLVGLFPTKKFKNPNQRTEEAVDKTLDSQ